jgi:hypothetical protein
MAASITASLRALEPTDPVRYDFSLCHVGMMGACGLNRAQRDSQCPLRGLCRQALVDRLGLADHPLHREAIARTRERGGAHAGPERGVLQEQDDAARHVRVIARRHQKPVSPSAITSGTPRHGANRGAARRHRVHERGAHPLVQELTTKTSNALVSSSTSARKPARKT